MGHGTFTQDKWDKIVASGLSTSINLAPKPEFLPRNITTRVSSHSAEKPNVTPIIIALDVTGSMGEVLKLMLGGALTTLMLEILKRKSIVNPQICWLAIGDSRYDYYPLQATQFEADERVATQLRGLFIEGGGGPGSEESYPLAWWFAANKTDIDCLIDGRKGLLFTLGDEDFQARFEKSDFVKVLGEGNHQPMTAAEMFEDAGNMYEIFHLCIKEGLGFKPYIFDKWQELLGDHAIPIEDWTKIAEIIVSIIDRYCASQEQSLVVSTWEDPATRAAVEVAIAGLGTLTLADADYVPPAAPATDSTILDDTAPKPRIGF